MSHLPSTYHLTKNLLASGKPCNLFFLGDSITSAEWIHPNWREIVEFVLKSHFQTVFSNYQIASWQIRCFNAGFDGANTRDIAQLVSTYVVSHQPSIVLYQQGSNDNYVSISDSEYEDNIRSTLAQLEKVNAAVLLMSDLPSAYPEHNKAYQPRREILKKLAVEKALPYLDLYQAFEDRDISSFFGLISEGNEDAKIQKGEVDKMHPNITGNAYLAQAILKQFFAIEFDVEKYLREVKDGTVFYPGL